MPELPEVETVVRGLRKTIVGRTIKDVRTNAPKTSIVTGRSLARTSFESALKGRTVLEIQRRGKNILIRLSNDITLWAHLKMTGRFLYIKKQSPIHKHDLAIFDFKDHSDSFHLRFNDTRRFGRLRLFTNDELLLQPGIKELGPEPLELDADSFIKLLSSRSRMIKPALLDQSFIAGLGNIYTDEALHFSRIHPRKLTDRISRKKLYQLHAHIRRLLKKAIRHMGTSVDSYSGVNGQPGSFQKYLKVYGNEGLPCTFCGHRIVREVIGSRSAHFCPRCQRL